MDVTSVTLEEVFAAAHARAASLVPETSGYLALAIADAAARLPFRLDDELASLTTEGTVQVARGSVVVTPAEATARLRGILARLLERSVGSMPGLAAAARPRTETEEGPESFVRDLEAALVPVNRAAARRALARLARETAKARDAGRLRRRARPSAPAPAAPQPAPAQHAADVAREQAAAQQRALQQAAAQQAAAQQAAAQQAAAQHLALQQAAAQDLAARQLAAQQELAARHLAAQQALAAQQQADAQALAAQHLALRPDAAVAAADPVSTDELAARLLAVAYAPLPPSAAPASFSVSPDASLHEGALFPADGAEPTPTTLGMAAFEEVGDPTIVDAPVVAVPEVVAAPRRDAGPRIVLAPELATRRGRGFVTHRVASIEPDSRSDVDDLLSRFAPPQSDEQLARALLKVSVGLDPTPPPPQVAPAPRPVVREEARPARLLPANLVAPVVPIQGSRRGLRVALVALGLLGVGLLGHWLPAWLDAGDPVTVGASAR